MIELSVNNFRANLKSFVDKVIDEHQAIRVKRRTGRDFIVISAEDWDREQETLYVLRNSSLMKQIAESEVMYKNSAGYKPTGREMDKINYPFHLRF
ncbi:MAG: type II toxin-antitoxin system Phd/YefM family antitoxin [Bacteroidia bacterium]|nr:type II toxin-antitoxin system Phd/YefM family antitoxin [Bacteroidia bacterium]